ncbi:hypothetical protein GZ77_12820 [Endozoicomonas montiporae]|uniref:Type III secretion chaperone SycN n=2 Tax=Endozoicomonas montiporae TaxID=1027273 RepID=A0A081N0D5_9GAMM|nr:hypothetical protein [Endozoicomonas montiporae]AMO57847.1 type III secretion chaperone SycN [Endozoicomonas montiporae CL-33]KEQ11908.1 hypothetical protein GZ77_22605 [Endozoicomonas montiporae]KEQ13308.1 hypothetical protein GZ77_12820 [Endozoicomonas montiporae]
MDWRDDVMADIGKGMGIEGLGFGESGVLSLNFERRGELYLEQQDDGVLMYLVRTIPVHDCLGLLVAALKECHYTKASRFPLQVGLKGEEELLLFIYLANEEFTRPNIETSIDTLTQQFEKIGSV